MVIYRVSPKEPKQLIMGSLIIFLACLFIGCDGSGELETSEGYGSLAFQVQWEETGTSPALSDNTDQEVAALTALNCEEKGVFWVNMIVYDSSNQYVTESEWPCGDHAGTISGISAGTDRKVVIFGKSATKEILYRGHKSNINVIENEITDAGLIEAYYFVPTGGYAAQCGGSDSNYHFSWQAVPSAASYELQVATDNTFANLLVNVTVNNPKTDCFPFASGVFYWRARTLDFDGLKSAWSEIWQHGTAPEPPPPPGPPAAPIGGRSTECLKEPSYYFLWQAVQSAASYDFQLATDKSFANPEVNVTVNNSRTNCYPLPSDNNPYYWRARTIGDNGLTSDWSEVWRHNTPEPTPPPVPPAAPTGGADASCNDGYGTRFYWDIVPSAAEYDFQIYSNPNFTDGLSYELRVSDPETGCISDSDLDYSLNYWRVRTIGNNGLRSAWSRIWTRYNQE